MNKEPIVTNVWVKTISYKSESGAFLEYEVSFSGNTVEVKGPYFDITMPLIVAQCVARAINNLA